MLPYILMSLIIIADIFLIFARNKVNDKIGLILKLMASINFIVLGFVCYFYSKDIDHNYGTLIIIGLFFGLFGDILLGIRRLINFKILTFIIGLLFFLIGHLVYIYAFINIGDMDYFVVLLFTLTFFVVSLIIGKKANLGLKKIKYCILLYLLISSTLLAITLSILISSNVLSYRFIVTFIAAILFVLSDATLCFIYFKTYQKNKNKLCIISSSCYLLAQNLFALSILLS